MTKQQAIDQINARLLELDEERVRAVADMIQALDAESTLPRELTDRELALIEQSREDFRAGRTLTSAEARASIDEFLQTLGVPKSGQ